jgi:hypothetical protein
VAALAAPSGAKASAMAAARGDDVAAIRHVEILGVTKLADSISHPGASAGNKFVSATHCFVAAILASILLFILSIQLLDEE